MCYVLYELQAVWVCFVGYVQLINIYARLPWSGTIVAKTDLLTYIPHPRSILCLSQITLKYSWWYGFEFQLLAYVPKLYNILLYFTFLTMKCHPSLYYSSSRILTVFCIFLDLSLFKIFLQLSVAIITFNFFPFNSFKT